MSRSFWLMKSEPNVYSIEDLEREGQCFWEGIRNYQARNMMRDLFRVGDQALFYHSNATPPGAMGVMEVVKESYPDHTSWDSESKYFDAKSSKDNPRWVMVDVAFKEKFARCVSLQEMREHDELADMKVLQKGSRLSIQPLTETEFLYVCQLGRS